MLDKCSHQCKWHAALRFVEDFVAEAGQLVKFARRFEALLQAPRRRGIGDRVITGDQPARRRGDLRRHRQGLALRVRRLGKPPRRGDSIAELVATALVLLDLVGGEIFHHELVGECERRPYPAGQLARDARDG